jgi:hypothetical protein
MNTNGTIGPDVQRDDWSSGWTTAEFYTIGGSTFLFLLKESDGAVCIKRMNTNGTIDPDVQRDDWSSGWTTAEFYTIGGSTFLFLLKESDGAVCIKRMNTNGTIGPDVQRENQDGQYGGWTTAEFYTIGGNTFLFLLKQSAWAELAHELGHYLFEYPFNAIDTDLYERTPRDEGPGPITEISDMGYLGRADLMGHHWRGSHFNAFFKLVAGWLDPTHFVPDRPSMTRELRPVYMHPRCAVLIRPNIAEYPDEFFLVETRGHPHSTNWQGRPISFDRNLNDPAIPVESLTMPAGGLFVYHLNTRNFKGGSTRAEVAEAQPLIDLIGEPEGATWLNALRRIDRLESWQTCFYDGCESGLEIEILHVSYSMWLHVRLSWNWNPRLSAVASGHSIYVFGRDNKGRLIYKFLPDVRDGSSWFPSPRNWATLGDRIQGRPVAMSSGFVDVFAHHKGGVVAAWRFPHGSTRPSSTTQPYGVVRGGIATLNRRDETNQSYVAYVDSGRNVILSRQRGDESWTMRATQGLGGDILGSPAIAKDREGRLHVFARSRRNTLLYIYQDDAGRWQQPSPETWFEDSSQRIDTNPVAIANQVVSLVHVFARSIDGSVVSLDFHSRGLSHSGMFPAWTNLGNRVMGPPAALQDSNGVIHIFATDMSHNIIHRFFRYGRWTAWESLTHDMLAIDSPVAVAYENLISIFFMTRYSSGVLHGIGRPGVGGWDWEWKSVGPTVQPWLSLRTVASTLHWTGNFSVRDLAEAQPTHVALETYVHLE